MFVNVSRVFLQCAVCHDLYVQSVELATGCGGVSVLLIYKEVLAVIVLGYLFLFLLFVLR